MSFYAQLKSDSTNTMDSHNKSWSKLSHHHSSWYMYTQEIEISQIYEFILNVIISNILALAHHDNGDL